MSEPARPDPDALLARTRRAALGRLKVFLGAAPGVGKTFEMLNEARRRHASGDDILVGIVESHGRGETEAQLGDLPILPRQRLDYRGQVLEEFDLDAALARKPAVLLLDELAHSNAPGSRHPKRWMDVVELQAAGIDVWTTMNVQHLEGLSEAVARITGVRVAETVPDSVLAQADAVELIDIPPSELLDRLRTGKVYRSDQAERALRGFFKEGNLAALRELALRRLAERVDADVSEYMRENAITGPWPAGDKVLALVGSDPGSEAVIRQARRIADALRAPLLAMHVERPEALADSGAESGFLALAQSLGAESETVIARDVPAAILTLAARRNVTHIVIGRGQPRLWRRLTGRTLSGTLHRRATDFSLHIVPATVPMHRPERERRALPAWLGWLASAGLVAAATGVALGLDEHVPEGSLGMVYLVAIVAVAVAFGSVQGVIAAGVSFLCWNYLFLTPRFTFAIAGAQDVLGAVVFVLIALLLTGAAGNLGRSIRASRARMFSLNRLVEFSRRLSASRTRADLLDSVAREAERLTERPCCVLMPLPPAPGVAGGEPVLRAAVPHDAAPDDAGLAAARWAMIHGRSTGSGTDTLPTGTAWQFRPMRTGTQENGGPAIVGLLGLDLASGRLDGEAERTLDAMLDGAAVAVERLDLIEGRARDAARDETEALRAALLTSLGHDLRTPLTSIRGAISTLRVSMDALNPAARADLLAVADEEAERLGRYVANILDMVRIEGGEMRPRREAVDVAEAVEQATRRAGRATGRPVAFTAEPHLRPARLDPNLLDQLLDNLLGNALKFSPPEGKVEAAVSRAGPDVMISITDDGIGIPVEDLQRIFNPFFRAHRTDRVAAGTGLGLAICQGLVSAMGGRIAAQSPVVGKGGGTRITVSFPL